MTDMIDQAEMIDLAAYQGKRVVLKRTVGDSVEEIEGTVELVNGPAMILKPRGSVMNKLIETASIVPGSMELVPEKPRELKAKRLDPVSLSSVRAHLLDRHSYELPVINSMSDEQAYMEHDEIDHDRLGHFHADKNAPVEGDDEAEGDDD